MSTLEDAWTYLTTAQNWTGANGLTTPTYDGGWTWANDSIIALSIEHLFMSIAAVTIAAVIALPLGIYLGHARRGGTLTVIAANATRAMPTLALLTLFAASAIGFGNRAVVIAVAIFAFPPILTNAFTGMVDVDADVRDAAKGIGMTARQITTRVEVPLAVPLIAAGMRTASVQSVATVPIAALVGGGGLGVIINTGIATQRFGQVLAGGIIVALFAVTTDFILGRIQRRVTPPQLRAATRVKSRA